MVWQVYAPRQEMFSDGVQEPLDAWVALCDDAIGVFFSFFFSILGGSVHFSFSTVLGILSIYLLHICFFFMVR